MMIKMVFSDDVSGNLNKSFAKCRYNKKDVEIVRSLTQEL